MGNTVTLLRGKENLIHLESQSTQSYFNFPLPKLLYLNMANMRVRSSSSQVNLVVGQARLTHIFSYEFF